MTSTKHQDSRMLNSSMKMCRSRSTFNINDFYLTNLLALKSDSKVAPAANKSQIISPLSLPKKIPAQKYEETAKAVHAESRLNNKFFNRLVGAVKEFYGARPKFLNLFHKFDSAFQMQGKIIENVSGYKPELGVLIEESVSTLYQSCIDLLNFAKKEIDQSTLHNEQLLKVNTERMLKLESHKTKLEDLLMKYEHLVGAKNTEFDIYQGTIKTLRAENDFLSNWIKEHIELTTSYALKPENDAQFKYKDFYKNIDDLRKHALDLQDVINSMEREAYKRSEISSQFTGVLNEMLKGSKHDQSTQVYEHELCWDSDNAITPQKLENMNVNSGNILELGVNIHDKDSISKVMSQGDVLTQANFDKKKKKGGSLAKLDLLESSPKQSKYTEGSYEVKGKAFQLEFGMLKNFGWTMSCTLEIFLDNLMPQKDTVKVLPWSIIKKDIEGFESYMLLASKSLTSRVSMTTQGDDYLCMYFLDTYKMRRVAELKLLEFLVSLRYYCPTNTQALNCAMICNVIICEDVKSKRKGSTTDFDIYFLNFYLYVLSEIQDQDKEDQQNDKSVSTMSLKVAIDLAEEISTYFDVSSREGFMTKLNSIARDTETSSVRGLPSTSPMIYIDKFIYILLEEYLTSKKKMEVEIIESFLMNAQSDKISLSLEEAYTICLPSTSRVSYSDVLQFPSNFNVAKSYLYAITGMKNNYILELDLFMEALSKFGVLSSYPYNAKTVQPGYGLKLNQAKVNIRNLNDSRRSSVVKPGSPKKQTINSMRDTQTSRGGLSVPKGPETERRRGSFFKDSRQPLILKDLKIKHVNDDTSIDKAASMTKEKESYLRLDNTSALLAQHYSLIRELKTYTQEFKQLIVAESEIKEVWTCFENLAQVLETGCQFLSFPVQL